METNRQFSQSGVKVRVCSFNQLLATGLPLALDSYQRAYVWDEKKITQLLVDLVDFTNQTDTSAGYYMGSILLHLDQQTEVRFVIDGQQRLTSLCLLYHYLVAELPENIDFKYRSGDSVTNIQNARVALQVFDSHKIKKQIFSQIRFTVITVAREDLAFTFFDTQNSRGVKLQASDLLKAFHLRAIGNNERKLQENCVRRWQFVQNYHFATSNKAKDDFAPELFERFLWRARNWRGQKTLVFETYDAVLETFQANSVKAAKPNAVRRYPGPALFANSELRLQTNGQYSIHGDEHALPEHARDLPFLLRQPIQQGPGFFLYAEKYAALLKFLFNDPMPDAEVAGFRDFYQRVIIKAEVSNYLQQLYKLASLMYVDKFGSQGLFPFILWLDYVLGALRLYKEAIFAESPLVYLKEAVHNLLDWIAGAFEPMEVMDFLRLDQMAASTYRKDKVLAITRGSDVRGRYLAALLDFYEKDSLANRDKWIPEYLRIGKNNA